MQGWVTSWEEGHPRRRRTLELSLLRLAMCKDGWPLEKRGTRKRTPRVRALTLGLSSDGWSHGKKNFKLCVVRLLANERRETLRAFQRGACFLFFFWGGGGGGRRTLELSQLRPGPAKDGWPLGWEEEGTYTPWYQISGDQLSNKKELK